MENTSLNSYKGTIENAVHCISKYPYENQQKKKCLLTLVQRSTVFLFCHWLLLILRTLTHVIDHVSPWAQNQFMAFVHPSETFSVCILWIHSWIHHYFSTSIFCAFKYSIKIFFGIFNHTVDWVKTPWVQGSTSSAHWWIEASIPNWSWTKVLPI